MQFNPNSTSLPIQLATSWIHDYAIDEIRENGYSSFMSWSPWNCNWDPIKHNKMLKLLSPILCVWTKIGVQISTPSFICINFQKIIVLQQRIYYNNYCVSEQRIMDLNLWSQHIKYIRGISQSKPYIYIEDIVNTILITNNNFTFCNYIFLKKIHVIKYILIPFCKNKKTY